MKGIHYFYKITNLINGHYYYGIRTCHCLPGKDPYMGSGIRLHKAYRKYGIENFKKEIIRVCKTREDVLDLERWIVYDKLINDNSCYNMSLGGGKSGMFGGVLVKDSNGSIKVVSVREYRSNKGKYISHISGKVSVYDKDSERFTWITSDEYRNNKDRYITINKFKQSNNITGKVLTKDSSGCYFWVSKSDPRYLSGELVHIWKGRSHSQDTKDKISKSNSISLSGERNSHYGTKWMTNPEGISKPIKKNLIDEYISKGWKLGRKMNSSKNKYRENDESKEDEPSFKFKSFRITTKGRINITNGHQNKLINKSDLDNFINNGWRRELTQFKVHEHNPNSGNLGKRWIHNENLNKRKLVSCNKLDEYLSLGWVIGYK